MSSSVPYFIDEDEPTGGFTDSPEFNALKEEIVTRLFEINGQISTLQQFIATLESLLKKGNVSVKVVDRIDKKAVVNIRKVGGLIKDVNEQVQKIDAIEESSLDKPEIIAREKLVRDVRYSLQEFQSTQRKYTTVIREINDLAKAALSQEELEQQNINALREEEEHEEGSQKLQQQSSDIARKPQITIQREPINNEEFAYQQSLIRQRDQEISNIEEGINELNEIFNDLGNVVQQQSVMVDNIEANIYSTSDNTAMASRELTKAFRSQRSANKWCLYLLVGLLVMLFMLLLIVFI